MQLLWSTNIGRGFAPIGCHLKFQLVTREYIVAGAFGAFVDHHMTMLNHLFFRIKLQDFRGRKAFFLFQNGDHAHVHRRVGLADLHVRLRGLPLRPHRQRIRCNRRRRGLVSGCRPRNLVRVPRISGVIILTSLRKQWLWIF